MPDFADINRALQHCQEPTTDGYNNMSGVGIGDLSCFCRSAVCRQYQYGKICVLFMDSFGVPKKYFDTLCAPTRKGRCAFFLVLNTAELNAAFEQTETEIFQKSNGRKMF